MKKLMFVGALALTLVACKSEKKEDKKEEVAPVHTAAAAVDGGVKIAFYVLDSVAETFEVYKKENETFEKEGQQLQNQLIAMQKEMERVYREYETGAKQQILTPNQMANYEQKIGSLQQKIAEFQNNKMGAFQQRQIEATTAIQNKINKYSEEFCRENKIDLLLVSGTGSQVGYGNPSMDMTVKFVEFMNEKEKSVGK
jgi:Skp family chaperone for outer membrane proteins